MHNCIRATAIHIECGKPRCTITTAYKYYRTTPRTSTSSRILINYIMVYISLITRARRPISIGIDDIHISRIIHSDLGKVFVKFARTNCHYTPSRTAICGISEINIVVIVFRVVKISICNIYMSGASRTIRSNFRIPVRTHIVNNYMGAPGLSIISRFRKTNISCAIAAFIAAPSCINRSIGADSKIGLKLNIGSNIVHTSLTREIIVCRNKGIGFIIGCKSVEISRLAVWREMFPERTIRISNLAHKFNILDSRFTFSCLHEKVRYFFWKPRIR